MPKLNKRQEQIVKAINALPEKMTHDEFEALICSLISASLGFDQVPSFLLYMHHKTKAMQERMAERAKKETKH